MDTLDVGRKGYKFTNAIDPLTGIMDAISGIGQGVEGVFSWLEKKQEGKNYQSQAELDAIRGLEARKRTTSIIIGAVALVALVVGGIVIVRKLK